MKDVCEGNSTSAVGVQLVLWPAISRILPFLEAVSIERSALQFNG